MKDMPESDISIEEFRAEIHKKSSKSRIKKSNRKAESRLQLIESYLGEKYDMRFNSILSLPEFKLKGDDSQYSVINENSVYRELEHNGYRCTPATVKTLLKSNFLPEYNPIIEYFQGQKKYDPEKEPDYIDCLGNFIIVKEEDRIRFRIQIKKFLVRCLACSLYRITNKQALVIISPAQNTGKSTFCRWLCPPELNNYIQENISIDKDSQIALTENFIINMDELATLSRADLEGLKSFMSKDIVKTRKPYDSKALPYQRIANFVGSTNNIEFLTDVTGSVRWLCFEVDSINFNYKKEIPIDRLWAQALYLFKSGFKYQMSADELQENDRINACYRQISNEEDLIQRTYTPGKEDDHDEFLSATEILDQLRIAYPAIAKDLLAQRVGKALHALGFNRVIKRTESGPRRGYFIKKMKSSIKNDYMATF